jgi:RNA polymerase sigma-70 factor (ECF subfamily)
MHIGHVSNPRRISTAMLTSFLQAVVTGETNALMNLLAEQVTFWADGGGKVKGEPRRPIVGRIGVVRFFLRTLYLWPPSAHAELGEVNGQPALIIRTGEKAIFVLVLDVEHGQIQTIWVVANPDKLTRV